jgi:uncharacterized protein YcfL
MLFDILKEKFDILSPIDSSILTPAPQSRSYVIAYKNGELHFSLHVSTSKIQELFSAYNTPIPEIMPSLIENTDFVLIDLNTIQTSNIKFYIRIEHTNRENILTQYPFAPSSGVSVVNKYLIGFSCLINTDNNSVEQYKYYWYDGKGETFVHRFDGQGKFIEENVEYATHSLTANQLADFDSRLANIDVSNLRTAKTIRTAGDQSYIGIIEGDYEPTSSSVSVASQPDTTLNYEPR